MRSHKRRITGALRRPFICSVYAVENLLQKVCSKIPSFWKAFICRELAKNGRLEARVSHGLYANALRSHSGPNATHYP